MTTVLLQRYAPRPRGYRPPGWYTLRDFDSVDEARRHQAKLTRYFQRTPYRVLVLIKPGTFVEAQAMTNSILPYDYRPIGPDIGRKLALHLINELTNRGGIGESLLSIAPEIRREIVDSLTVTANKLIKAEAKAGRP